MQTPVRFSFGIHRLLVVCLVIAATVSLVGCGGTSTNPTTPQGTGGPGKSSRTPK
jgi:hypothetical protein